MLTRDVVLLRFARPSHTVDAGDLAILDEGERERLARFHFERDRALYLAAHVLVRRTLARILGVADPSDLRFVTGEHGRPELRDPGEPPLRFNLSHTRGLVACAVTVGGAVGVDVERLRPDPPLDILDTAYAPSEREVIRSLPRAERARRFFQHFTVKESYLKARGVGFGLPPQAVVLRGLDPPTLWLDEDLGDSAARYLLVLLDPTPDHVAALCVERGPAEPRVVVELLD